MYLVEATLDDLQKLKEIVHQTFHDSFASENTVENMKAYTDAFLSTAKIREELNDPKSKFYFTIFENKTVGYLKIKNLSTENSNSASTQTGGMQLQRLYVVADYQGQKIGQWMLEEVITMAKKAKSDYLWLGVWDRNERAIKFYERNDFYRAESIDFQLGDELQRDFIMKYEIRN